MLAFKLIEDFQFNDIWSLTKFKELSCCIDEIKSKLLLGKLQVDAFSVFYYIQHDYTRDFLKPALFPVFLLNAAQPEQLKKFSEYVIDNRELFASKKLIPVILDVCEGSFWLPEHIEAMANSVKDICTVYFIDGNKRNESLTSINHYYYYFWLYFSVFNTMDIVNYYKFDNTVVNLDEDHKIFICLNRLARYHRVTLVSTLVDRNLRQHGYLSWAGVRAEFDWKEEYPTLLNEVFDVLDVDDVAADNPTHKLPTEFSKKSFIFLNTETNYDNTSMFLSEKVFKPMLLGMPFILLGNTGVLGFLKSLGFKTFDKWIDESYDTDIPLQERCDIIANEIQRFSLMTPQERIQIRHEMHETTQHNIKTLRDLAKSNNIFSILQNIEDVALKS